MGIKDAIFRLFSPSTVEKKPDETDVWVSGAKLKAVRDAFDDRMDGMDKRLDEFKKRLAKCEQTYTAEIHELEAENEALAKENEGLTSHVQAIETPSDSREVEAAKVLAGWGYSESQILKAAELLKQNAAVVEEFLEGEEDEPISTVMKRNRLLIDMFLKSKIGPPAAAASSAAKGAPSGMNLYG